MEKRLPDAVITAVRKLVHEAQVNNEILDAYGAAERIKRTFPGEELATGELVAVMLEGGPAAMELSRPAALIIEVILPPGTEPEGDAIDVALTKDEEATA